MKKYNIKIKIFALLIVVSACSDSKNNSRVDTLPFYEDASFTPFWLTPHSKEANAFHAIPDFSLTNQRGETVTQEVIQSKATVVDFFFTTCPGICPKMTTNMAVLQDSFMNNDHVVLLSYSVTPEIDSVPTLAAYAERKNITSPNWHLLTGDRKQIYDLGRKAYFVEEDLGETKSDEDFLHTENFVLLDGDRHIRGIYNGLNKAAIQQLVADIRTLKGD
jgi:protein SCO1/2